MWDIRHLYLRRHECTGWISSHIWWYNNIQNSRILFNWMCKKPWGAHTQKKTRNKLDRCRVLSHSFTTDANAPLLFENACVFHWMALQLLTKSSRPWLRNYFPDSWFSVITYNHLLGIWSRLCYSFCFLFCTSYLVNPVDFSIHLERGTWGGGGDERRNTAEKVNEHRIPARKVHETPSPSQTVRFEITATPQIEILFTASKNINTANPHVPFFKQLCILKLAFLLSFSKDYYNVMNTLMFR